MGATPVIMCCPIIRQPRKFPNPDAVLLLGALSMSFVPVCFRSIFLPVALLVLSLTVFGSLVGCGSEANENPEGERATLGKEGVRLHISISDRTGKHPLSEHFAIEAPGEELWRPNIKFGRATRQFAVYPVGKEYELVIYPRGKNGPRQRVPFSMKASMKSGTALSKTQLKIYDDSIITTGPAVPGGRMSIAREHLSTAVGP